MAKTVRRSGHEAKEDGGAHCMLRYEDETCLLCGHSSAGLESIERKASKFSEVGEVGL